MATMGKWFAKSLVVDAHNEGVRPFNARYNCLLPIYRFIQRRADLTIVTNEKLAHFVQENRGRAIVLPDKIPQLKRPRRIGLKGEVNIVFICTFEKDEPFREVIAATRLLKDKIHLYITGRYEKISENLMGSAASNLTFTGFLSEQDFADLLFSCDAIMDLTLMEDCLVCGAYEAVSLGKPMILSDTQALRQFFHAGAVYTANDRESIASAMHQMADKRERLQAESRALKESLETEWQTRFLLLKNRIAAF